MSATFLLTFCGHPVRRIVPGVLDVCTAAEATQFASEADAWLAAKEHCLDFDLVCVRPVASLCERRSDGGHRPPLQKEVA